MDQLFSMCCMFLTCNDDTNELLDATYPAHHAQQQNLVSLPMHGWKTDTLMPSVQWATEQQFLFVRMMMLKQNVYYICLLQITICQQIFHV